MKRCSAWHLRLALWLPILLASGCATYQQPPPSINLSPESMNLSAVTASAADVGWDIAVNESDSLDNLEILPGVKLLAVRPNSTAAQAHLQANDVVLTINAVKVNHPDTVNALLQDRTQKSLDLSVRRDTTVFATTLALPSETKLLTARELYRVDPLRTRTGFRTESVTLATTPVQSITVARVVEFFPDSPLPAAGVKLGDAVVALNGKAIESAQDLINTLNDDTQFGDKVVVTLLDHAAVNGRRDLKLALWSPDQRLSRVQIPFVFSYENKDRPARTINWGVVNIFSYSLLSYKRVESERSYNLIFFIKFKTGIPGELVDHTIAPRETP